MGKLVFTRDFLQHADQIKKHLSDCKQAPDPEPIHDLRVEFKKIRSLAILFDRTGYPEYARKYKKLNLIFKKAGTVREKQVHLQLLKKMRSVPATYKARLEAESRKKIKYFKHHIGSYITEVAKFEGSLKGCKPVLRRRKVKKFLDREIKKASGCVKNEKKLHRLRTHVKRVMYIYKTLPEREKNRSGLNEKYLDLIQSRIGEWHDTILLIDLLKEASVSDTVILRLQKKAKAQLIEVFYTSRKFKKKVFFMA